MIDHQWVILTVLQVLTSVDTPIQHLTHDSIVRWIRGEAGAESRDKGEKGGTSRFPTEGGGGRSSAGERGAEEDQEEGQRRLRVFVHTCGELWAFSLADGHIISRIR